MSATSHSTAMTLAVKVYRQGARKSSHAWALTATGPLCSEVYRREAMKSCHPKWDTHHFKNIDTYSLQNDHRHESYVVPLRVFSMCVCVWGGGGERLQAPTVANITAQISINNTIWFQIKGANKCVHAHLASQIQSTDGYTAGQLLWRKKMLMSIHCRAQSQTNRGNGLIFLASMLSKVTAMPRNGAAVSGTQQCSSLGVCLSASGWLDRRSSSAIAETPG